MVLRSRVEAPDWTANGDPEAEAKCRRFPLPSREHGRTEDPFFDDEDPEATHVCNGTYDGVVCPFRATCLYHGLINNAQHGIWGGTMPVQRQWVRRKISKIAWDNPMLFDRIPPLDQFEPEEKYGKAAEK